jgi:hypothetical protein
MSQAERTRLKSSWVWNYFDLVTDSGPVEGQLSTRVESCLCKLCPENARKTYVYKRTTSSMLNHLRVSHPETCNAAPISPPAPHTRRDLDRVREKILDTIVDGLLPLSMVEQPAFRALMEEATAGQYCGMTRNTVMSHLEERWKARKTKVIYRKNNAQFTIALIAVIYSLSPRRFFLT